MHKISVVIPTFNRRDSVRRALTALLFQSFPSRDFEVIVSIDGSEDGTREMLSGFNADYDLRYIWDQNRGKSTACNRAIREADGDLIVMIDDDMEPTAGFLSAHYGAHLNKTRLGVIGAAPIVIDGDPTPVVTYITDKFNTHLMKISQPGYKIRIWDFYGGNFSIRKEIFSEIGLFNESYKVYGFEDVEYANRLLKAGVKIIYSSDAKCIQHYNDDYRGVARKTINSGVNAVHLVSDFPDTFDDLKLIEYNFTGWKWRSCRLLLIWMSILVPATTNLIIHIADRIGESKPHLFAKLNGLAMDYFFWLGVWIALRNNRNRKQLTSRIKSYKKPPDV